MNMSLIRLYDDPDTGAFGGFDICDTERAAPVFDPDVDFTVYVAM